MIDRNLINWFPGNTVPDIKYATKHRCGWRGERDSVQCLVVTNLNKTPHIQCFGKYGGIDERDYLVYDSIGKLEIQSEYWTWDCEFLNDSKNIEDSRKEWVLAWAYIGTPDESVILKEKDEPSVLGSKEKREINYENN